MIDCRPPVSGATRLYAVLGAPVAHSRSPALHTAWFAEHGVDAAYVALPVHAGGGEAIVPALRTLGLAGVNVTVPFKEIVADGLDELRGTASWLRTANTVVREGDRLVGHNTDAPGFVAGLRGAFGDVVTGRRVLVVGAGGAGLAVGAGLAQAGAASVTWLNRTQGRAEAAAARVAAACPGVLCGAGPLDAASFAARGASADVVVVATSGTGSEVVATLPFDRLGVDAVLCDLNYWQASPPWLARHRARGGRVQDGWPMLVHQAALAFALFTGISPDTEHVLRGIG